MLAKSRKRVSMWRLLKTRCRWKPSLMAVWIAPVGPRVERTNDFWGSYAELDAEIARGLSPRDRPCAG